MFIDPFVKLTPKRKLTAADKKRVAAKQGWKCNKCHKQLPVRYHVDHIKEIQDKGSDKISNLQALCGTCHDNKTEEDRNKRKQRKILQADSQRSYNVPRLKSNSDFLKELDRKAAKKNPNVFKSNRQILEELGNKEKQNEKAFQKAYKKKLGQQKKKAFGNKKPPFHFGF